MAWKNIKNHYRIEHRVHVDKRGICVSSPYIDGLIVIGWDGHFLTRYTKTGNKDLMRYQAEMDADPETLIRLVQAPDIFSESHVVYTYDGARIIEKKCEAVGWPNVTHDGEPMYENTFSQDRQQVIEWARSNAKASVELAEDHLRLAEATLEKRQAQMSAAGEVLRELEAAFPPLSVGLPSANP